VRSAIWINSLRCIMFAGSGGWLLSCKRCLKTRTLKCSAPPKQCAGVKTIPQTRVLVAAVIFVAQAFPAFATEPMWAKKAVAFPERCPFGEYRYEDCKPIRILSPDGRSNIEVFYRPVALTEDDRILQAFLRLTTPTQGTRETALPEGFQQIDLLWSPDSKAFFVNGGNGGAYWGFWVYVYLADDASNPRLVTEDAQWDMLKEFPPCKAAFPNANDPGGCKKTSKPDEKTCMQDLADPKYSPEYNMTGIDWVNGSVILVVAEVPCSSSYGGIMCQVMGYELQVPTGQILERIDATQLKLRWQKSMAWNFRIPDSPRYCE
jgi:hypothetical protein